DKNRAPRDQRPTRGLGPVGGDIVARIRQRVLKLIGLHLLFRESIGHAHFRGRSAGRGACRVLPSPRLQRFLSVSTFSPACEVSSRFSSSRPSFSRRPFSSWSPPSSSEKPWPPEPLASEREELAPSGPPEPLASEREELAPSGPPEPLASEREELAPSGPPEPLASEP